MRRLEMTVITAVVLAVLGTGTPTETAHACTAFFVAGGDGPVVGKSYDWSVGRGLVLFNKEGVTKRALALDSHDRPAEWTSRYASLTFNQYGRELPNGGMNTAGLVVEVLWLGATEFPPADQRPTVNELQWIQYQLDNYARVAEVVAHADELRISGVYAKVHYLTCDGSGECAAIEHLGGKTVIATGASMPVRALTNDTYAESLAALRRHRGFGGTLEAPAGTGSRARFVRTAARVSGEVDHDAKSYALESLEGVRSGHFTKWNILYEPRSLTVHFRTAASPALKTVSMARFDSSCAMPVRMLDIDHESGGDVSAAFVDYAPSANAAVVEGTLNELGVVLPLDARHRLIGLPETDGCRAPGGLPAVAASGE